MCIYLLTLYRLLPLSLVCVIYCFFLKGIFVSEPDLYPASIKKREGIKMISRYFYLWIFLPMLLLSIYGGCGGSSGGGTQPTQKPTPQPTPTSSPVPTISPGACNSPLLNTPYVVDGEDKFFIYNAAGSTLDTEVYSDGANVFVLVTDGVTTFGFSGKPTGAGTGCDLVRASADYDNDGNFDETAKTFSSRCLRLDNGSRFTYLDGPGKVDASKEFEQKLLVLYNQVLYYNVYDALGCNLTEPVAQSGLYESLLRELRENVNTL